MSEQDAAINTDREIWRERPGDFYADSIHVTDTGSIGINCGGKVYVMPVREWHGLVDRFAARPAAADAGVREALRNLTATGERVAKKYGLDADGELRDWTEWRDFRDTLASAALSLEAKREQAR